MLNAWPMSVKSVSSRPSSHEMPSTMTIRPMSARPRPSLRIRSRFSSGTSWVTIARKMTLSTPRTSSRMVSVTSATRFSGVKNSAMREALRQTTVPRRLCLKELPPGRTRSRYLMMKTGVPTGTFGYSFTIWLLATRMQPWLAAVPMLPVLLVPWIRMPGAFRYSARSPSGLVGQAGCRQACWRPSRCRDCAMPDAATSR